jgi:exopolyphosphatase
MHLSSHKNSSKEIFHIILGNQSADLDSIASSLTLTSHYLAKTGNIYAPVINIPRSDLALRKDVLYVLNFLKINPDKFLFSEDIPSLLAFAKQGSLRVTLVDHNQLAPGQEGFKDYVERIVDHHKDENIDYPSIKEKLISTDGSNSTLIGSIVAETCTPEMAYLLLAAILLDTGNLKNSKITTDEDIRIATLLAKKAGTLYSDNLYDVLFDLRHDAQHLSPDLLLKKDYKLYKEGEWLYGIASIPKGIFWGAENRMQWKDALVDTVEKQKIFMLGVLGYAENGHDKIFIACIPAIHEQEAFLENLKRNNGLKDELILKEYFPEECLLFFDLRIPLKRKHLQPLLQMTRIQHQDPKT